MNLAGVYVATSIEVFENCTVGTNGVVARFGLLRVEADASGSAVTGSFAEGQAGGCTYNLTLVQTGSVATGNGSFSCSDGSSGDVEVEAVRAFDDVITAQLIRRYRSGDTCTTTTFVSGTQ